MKSWELSDEIRRVPKLIRHVEDARSLLEEAIGPASAVVDARWTLADSSGGQKRLALTLSDWTWPEGIRVEFEDWELLSPLHARRRFYRLWGDLLQARNHRQIQQLQQTA